VIHLKTFEELKYTKGAKKSKRKIGSFAKHCICLGYKGTKGGKCYGKKVKNPEQLDFDKDYFYDLEDN
jgi:hypothetical protein